MALDSNGMTGRESPGTFSPRTIGIPVKPLLRLQGYRDLERVRPRIEAAAREMAQRAEGLLEAHVHYRCIGVRGCDDGVLVLETGAAFHSGVFSEVLRQCREVIAFVLTVGEGLDAETAARTEDGDMLGALFLETAGWLGVEKATREFSRHLKAQAAKRGLRLSRRMGPGYGDWPLEEQAGLFDLFAGDSLPVRLLDSCAMIPKMSRSGLYGLLPSAAQDGESHRSERD